MESNVGTDAGTDAAFGLPGLNCGLCGHRACADFAKALKANPEAIKRCVHLSPASKAFAAVSGCAPRRIQETPPAACVSCETASGRQREAGDSLPWTDSLGREFDFILEHFPWEPGPRETVLPHNPLLTRELKIAAGDVLVGRPLGVSCGCPITHCGVAQSVDARTGVIVWCVTGPLKAREGGFKDIGYYSAQAYEGLVKESRCELKIGMRHYFQPRMCMLQWRHSGLINSLCKADAGWQVRLEGLWIG